MMDIEDEGVQDEIQFEGLIQGLIDNDFGCCNDFISPLTMTGLSANITRLSESGSMTAAGIGNAKEAHSNLLIRSDTVNWIESKSTDPHEALYLKKIGNFIKHLNTTCYTSIKGFECHYSNYGKGDFYKRHLDQFKNEKGRKYSIVLYLNEDWKDADGGMLSLYPKGGKQQDISPVGGRMVFFRSNEMEHEVQTSLTRERRSIAGWLKD